MAINAEEVNKIAHLSRLELSGDEKIALQGDLNGIIDWVEQLKSIDTSQIEPMVGVTQHLDDSGKINLRQDEVIAPPGVEKILSNAPARMLNFFTITKVVE